jgi:integrase
LYSLALKGPLSDMSLTAFMRRMKVQATVHGFRSIFRDWVSECTSYPSEVAEMVLAHAVGDKVEAAYRRGDLLSRRMTLMQDSEQFLAGKTVSEVGTISSRVIFGNG